MYKMVGSFITGYSGGLTVAYGTMMTMADFSLYNLFLYPTLGGLIVVLPQVGKVFNELGNPQ